MINFKRNPAFRDRLAFDQVFNLRPGENELEIKLNSYYKLMPLVKETAGMQIEKL